MITETCPCADCVTPMTITLNDIAERATPVCVLCPPCLEGRVQQVRIQRTVRIERRGRPRTGRMNVL